MSAYNAENNLRNSTPYSCDSQGKMLLERVSQIEDHLGNLCAVLSDYTAKSALLRDKNDELGKFLAKFAKEEPFHTTTKLTMTLISELVARVGDHRNAEIQRMEAKVLTALSPYGSICKYLKTDIRTAAAAHDKEVSRRKDVDKFSEKLNDPKYRNAYKLAEGELGKALAESSRLNLLSQEQMIKFEHKRLLDVKESLETFFKIEIALHAKALELFSDAYRHVHSIDEVADLEILKAEMQLHEIQPKSSSRTLFKSNKGIRRGSGKRNSEKSKSSNYKIRGYNATATTKATKDRSSDRLLRTEVMQKIEEMLSSGSNQEVISSTINNVTSTTSSKNNDSNPTTTNSESTTLPKTRSHNRNREHHHHHTDVHQKQKQQRQHKHNNNACSDIKVSNSVSTTNRYPQSRRTVINNQTKKDWNEAHVKLRSPITAFMQSKSNIQSQNDDLSRQTITKDSGSSEAETIKDEQDIECDSYDYKQFEENKKELYRQLRTTTAQEREKKSSNKKKVSFDETSESETNSARKNTHNSHKGTSNNHRKSSKPPSGSPLHKSSVKRRN